MHKMLNSLLYKYNNATVQNTATIYNYKLLVISNLNTVTFGRLPFTFDLYNIFIIYTSIGLDI